MKTMRNALLHGLIMSALLCAVGMPAHAEKPPIPAEKPPAEIMSEEEIAATEDMEVTQTGDGHLTCDQIAHEVVELDRLIRNARHTQNRSDNAGTGVTVAKTVGSLLVGSLGGVVGIVAVGALAGEAAESTGEKAAAIEENAEERQNRLAGIFEGKGCEGELALTEDNPDDVAKIEPASGSINAKANRKPTYNE